MERSRLLLTRHAPTKSNKEGRLQGRLNVPVDEDGLPQAAALAETLKGEQIAAIYTSPLLRAIQTAETIQQVLEISEIQIIDDLEERDIGPFQGKSKEELPEYYKSMPLDYFFAQAEIPEAETPEQFTTRTLRTVKQIAQAHPDETVLIILHGGNIRALMDSAIVDDSHYSAGAIENNKVYALEVTNGVLQFLC